MKKIKILGFFLLSPLFILAASEGSDSNFYADLGLNLIGIIGIIVVVAAIALIVNLLNQAIKLRELQIYEEQGFEPYLEAKKKSARSSWWRRVTKAMTAAVPVEREQDILLNHDYDGIRELDNSLPPWWVYGFYLTIGISIFYVGYYHFSSNAKSSAELYEIEMEQAEAAVERYLATQANRVDESNVTLLTDAADLGEGKDIFDTYCAACHLKTGGGAPNSVGPNLTDKYWLHGGSIKDVFKTVKYGVPEKGMISWKDQLRPTEIHKVSSYILSLQGTNPPGAKEPQGELYVPEEDTENQDSVKVIGLINN